MENIILAAIFCIAAIYVGRKVWLNISGKGGCNCGTDSCSSKENTNSCSGCCGGKK